MDSEETASLLIQNSVSYVSNVPGTRVLVVRDDNHNNEDPDDPINYSVVVMPAMMPPSLKSHRMDYLFPI